MPGLVEGATIAIVTAVIVFLLIGAGGLWLISRRSRRGSPRISTKKADALATRANILLVRLDDSIKSGEEELGFALAEFGESATTGFAAATAAAKADLAEAFRLKQRLDDSEPDTATQTREWNARVIHLCESAQRSLDEQSAIFAGLRRSEKQAPQTLAAVRSLIDATAKRVTSAEKTLQQLQEDYAPAAVATVAGNAGQARGLLESAGASADRADQLIAAGGGGIAGPVAEAQADAQHAAQLLDAIGSTEASLAKSMRRLATLVGSAEADLAEAAAARDSPPDPDTGAAIGRAMAELERAIEESGGSTNPDEGIEWIERASAGLDRALAGARNQAQRLAHAKQALVGALVTARSQI